jgi:hypothetical protein
MPVPVEGVALDHGVAMVSHSNAVPDAIQLIMVYIVPDNLDGVTRVWGTLAASIPGWMVSIAVPTDPHCDARPSRDLIVGDHGRIPMIDANGDYPSTRFTLTAEFSPTPRASKTQVANLYV